MQQFLFVFVVIVVMRYCKAADRWHLKHPCPSVLYSLSRKSRNARMLAVFLSCEKPAFGVLAITVSCRSRMVCGSPGSTIYSAIHCAIRSRIRTAEAVWNTEIAALGIIEIDHRFIKIKDILNDNPPRGS
eukprot:3608872-Pleurochrysis_carterae.AAC.2